MSVGEMIQTSKRMNRAMFATVAVGVLCIVGSGCGGGGSTSEPASSTSDPASAQADPTAQFLGHGEPSHVVKFGQESDQAELVQATTIVAESLEARSSRDWSNQCATLSVSEIKTIEDVPGTHKGESCAKALAAQGKKASPLVLKDNLKGDVVVLRVKGTKGFALYHGTDQKDWAMPMEKEGSTWKVAGLVAEPIPDQVAS